MIVDIRVLILNGKILCYACPGSFRPLGLLSIMNPYALISSQK